MINNNGSTNGAVPSYSFENHVFNSISSYLKTRFGGKVIKLSIDGGFTCPNRDGTKSVGGCIFCSAGGSGELSGDLPEQIRLLSKKWPKARNYIAYFQAHTSTYAPVDILRKKFNQALDHPVVLGLAVATRPDCLSGDVLDFLSEINEKTFLWVELGLQTIHEKTAETINRCYPLSCYDSAISALSQRDIKAVTHLILGLPGENREDMLSSVRYVCRPLHRTDKPVTREEHIFGLKLHLMNVVSGSPMEKLMPEYVPFDSLNEYISLVCDILETIPPEITIHRLTGDVPRKLLIAPNWSYKKRTILNGIMNEMSRRGSWQGCRI
ncbi:MAG TPA: TIGR01212 family radical SAM protein [Bacillota bacterium]|nr:TIGR01212 family radical SAM protein [Bacillota bacterium]HUM56450.1 TIGR01212 family radical SAM protein [Bacillota bacterium]